MISPEIQSWYLKPGCGIEQLKSMLEDHFQIAVDAEDDLGIVSLLDDYDWAIWNADSLLLRSGKNNWQLYAGEEMTEVDGVKPGARFWWDLPDSEVRDSLKTLIDLRAAIPVVEVHLSRTHLVLRNDDDKIVVRLALTTLSDTVRNDENDIGRQSSFIQVKSLRGYQGPFNTAIGQMSSCLAGQIDSLSMKSLMKMHGYGPAEHDETPKGYGITKDETVELAIRQMSLQMLKTARSNEQGVIDDIDTEFLHHYRVSLRKTRSL